MFMFIILLIIPFISPDDCGICSCSPTQDRIVCTGKGFTEVPILPKDAIENAVRLGLQRNHISTITSDFVNAFHKLEVLDLRGQNTARRCVEVVGGAIRKQVKILGNYEFLLIINFLVNI